MASKRPGLGNPVEIGEHPLFEFHLLEHGLDHDIGFCSRIDSDHTADQAHSPIHILRGEAAARHCGAVIGGDAVAAFLQQVLAGLDQCDGNAGIGEAHGDAAAHRARADDRRAADRARLGARGHVRHPPRLALGEKYMALRFRLVAGDKFLEQLAFAPQAFVERQGEGVAHRFDASRRRLAAAEPAGQRRGGLVKVFGIGARCHEFVVAVARLLQWASLGNDAAGEGGSRGHQVTLDDFIDDAVSGGLGGADRVAGNNHPQCLFGADEARQALRAAGAGQEAELDLGEADPRRRNGDAEMTGERHLEPAPESGAVQCRDDRFQHRLDLGDDLA